ncbi:MAG: hypothetical protein DWI57_11780 [Chloroflexi bacterium]|nr:MAG: hypothetical protein DWI57_11780 [Chloroflexota bacterium]
MKKSARSFISVLVFKTEESFFRSGKNNQWQDVLTTEDIQHYNRRINQLLSPAEAAWLENGGRAVDA